MMYQRFMPVVMMIRQAQTKPTVRQRTPGFLGRCSHGCAILSASVAGERCSSRDDVSARKRWPLHPADIATDAAQSAQTAALP